MNILGISAFYHDSAAALLQDGKIIAAAQEERFTRIKHDPNFPTQAIKYCLEESGLTLDKLDAIVFYDKPLLKFERLLETYYAFSPKGLISFLTAIPVWLKEKMFLKRMIYQELKEIEDYNKKSFKLLFPEHHLSHAASAFYPSNFEDAAILTIDGVGEWATVSICHGQGKDITILKELHFPHSLGLLYSAFTYYTGFKVNSGEYKLMGLAPYGNPEAEQTKEFVRKIKETLCHIYPDGSIWLDQSYFNYATGLRMIQEKKWENLFGVPTRKSESPIDQVHCDLALAIQQVTEEVVILMAQEAKRLTGSKNLCMAGGVALNCVANGKLEKENIFENIFIQPAAGDAGGALGAAQAAYHIYFGQEREITDSLDQMQGSYLGPQYSELDIQKMGRKYNAISEKYADFDELATKTASLLADGNVIGWFQGRMEFGPRALGGRSILGDARNPEMQKKLNLKIKYREGFRPFAPSVLAEKLEEYFEQTTPSPYMLLVQPVKESRQNKFPDNYNSMPLMEKLYFLRSDLPSITHIDYSARIQTVHKETNPRYWKLISAFEEQTGYALVVNTSFNVRGEPIVCTPEDAYKCLMRTEMDYLVIGDFIFDKKLQPKWAEKDDWRTEFALD
ncbi:putative carbamoyl transferase, NodU family [Bernardetia litoralis DSM 6794]|uniref:Putative carbamoyl transferase, NodU family n=1 Tax=Bernardetia litoralis (strain ATCC 23117 / DSM 6794 / NBRC 15988 / NCIMB 1366 / Fx l1 / Sio-4) TaxID=880071 RepID=I4AQJ8_BERLS|nr:carbamoyltransferase [Bernardetia litoralis]AFM06233.1 putative carbamoyl transferase, NodU family [Bernardetia litoralis DSM 6794]